MTDTLTPMTNLPAIANTGLALTGDYEIDLAYGAKIREAAESLQFMLGDFVLSMEDKYGETKVAVATDCSRVTGVPMQTLRAYAQVARTFPADRRLAEASWSHHQAVCGNKAPTTTLRQAINEGLSLRDTRRLAKGLPVGGEDTAQKESSVAVVGASLEEVVLASIALAEEHLSRALATMSKPGFRLTVQVAQDIAGKLEATSKPFILIEERIKEECGAYL